MEEKIRNLTYIVIIGFVVMAILIIGLYFQGDSNTANNNSSGSSSSTTEYDVSEMNEVSVDEAVALFEEEGTHVLYIGRSGCTYCRQFVPVINEVQAELGFTTNYLDVQEYINNWQGSSDELEPLAELLTIEASANGESGTLGDLFLERGYTPVFVVIQDGEVVEGFFGYQGAEAVTSLLEEYL